MTTSRRLALTGWVIGGIPVIVSSLQALSALLGRDNVFWIPVVGGLIEAVENAVETEVIQQAQTIFYAQQQLIYGLFILTATAWVAQGIFMFTKTGRNLSYAERGSAGAVIMTAILYAFLFLGIYGGVLVSSPLIQALAFLMIPVIATGALLYAIIRYPWEEQRRQEAVEKLLGAGQKARDAKRELQTHVDELELEKLEELAPETVAEVTNIRDDFEKRCDQIMRRAAGALGTEIVQSTEMETGDVQKHLNDGGSQSASDAQLSTTDELEKTAIDIYEQAENLDVVATYTNIEEEVSEGFEQVIVDVFGGLEESFQSPFGTQYKIANLPAEHRTIEIGRSETITLTSDSQRSIVSQLQRLLEKDTVSVTGMAKVINQVHNHIEDQVKPYISDKEATFQKKHEQVEELLTQTRGNVEQINASHTASMTEKLLISGTRGEETDAATDIEERVKGAKQKLHKAKFDEAINEMEIAVAEASELNGTVKYIRSVLIPHLNEEHDTVYAPDPDTWEYDFMTRELLEELEQPLKNDFGADLDPSFDEENIEVDHDENFTESQDGGPVEGDISVGGRATGPNDAVVDLLKRLKKSTRDSKKSEGLAENQAIVSLGQAPDIVLAQNPVPELLDFLETHDGLDVVNHPTAEESGDGTLTHESPGYIKVKASEGRSIETELDRIVSEYETWARQE